MNLPWCRILGPLQVCGPGGEVRLGGSQQQAVLGLLALQPNVVVPRDLIVDALWGESPPATAVTMIHSCVSRLRRLLPAAPGSEATVITVSGGYRLRVADEELDSLLFARLAAAAARAREAGDQAGAFGLLAEALGLWRGEPLSGTGLLREHPAVARLRAQRAAAVIGYAETAASRAEREEAIPPLRELAANEPLNERAHACLMTTLTAVGQPAAAVEVFERIRRRLDTELGLLPGTELSAAQQRVLRGGEAGAGAPGPPAGPAAVSRAAPVPSQLPAVVADFTGRAAEASRLAGILTPAAGPGVPVAVICGLAGVGKTELALRVAHQLRPAFPDGQLWTQLDGASARPRDPGDVIGELLRALGVPGSAIPEALAEKAALYRSRLVGRKVLVLADDAGSARQVEPLIPGTAGSAVIVTSRMQLAELHGARILPLDTLGLDDALILLGRIAGRGRLAAEPAQAEALVNACGRLPLAVRIAGARLAGRPAWPVSLMSRALADHRQRLDELTAGGLSVRASLALSYQSLDDRSRLALCLLSLLGPADVAGWVIAALLGLPDADGVVGRLTDSSLLTPAGPDRTGSPRYRLHDLLRDYAAERLAAEYSGEQDAAAGRVLAAWLQLASRADAGLPREPYFPPPGDGPVPGEPVLSVVPARAAGQLTADPAGWFTAERRNLLSAVETGCGTGRYQLAARLSARLASYQVLHSRLDDTGRMWRAVLAAAQAAGDQAMTAQAELRIAIALCGQGRHASAAPVIGRCIAAFSAQADPQGLAAARYWRADCEFNLGHYRRARRTELTVIRQARQLADPRIEFLALRLLAITQVNLPDCRDEVARTCEQTLRAVRGLGQPAWELEAMRVAGHVAGLAGRYTDAADIYDQALELRQVVGVSFDEAGWLCVLADAHRGLGRYPEAVRAYLTALAIFRDGFQRRHLALGLLKLGSAYQAMGERASAVASISESVQIFRELQLPHFEQRAVREIEKCRELQPD